MKVLQGASSRTKFKLSEVLLPEILEEWEAAAKDGRKSLSWEGVGWPSGELNSYPHLHKFIQRYVPPDILRAMFSSEKGTEALTGYMRRQTVKRYQEENMRGLGVSYNDFEQKVMTEKKFAWRLHEIYDPTPGKAFKQKPDDLKAERALQEGHLEADMALLNETKERIEAAEEKGEGGSKECQQLGQDRRNKELIIAERQKKLSELDKQITLAKFNMQLKANYRLDPDVSPVVQHYCPACEGPLWSREGGNSDKSAMLRTWAMESPEIPTRKQQYVCQHIVTQHPVFSQEDYETITTVRRLYDHPEMLEKWRAHYEEEARDEGLEEEEIEEYIEDQLESTVARKTKTYNGKLQDDPYFIEFEAKSVDDLPITQEQAFHIFGVDSLEALEELLPIPYWHEICGFPVNLSSPHNCLKAQFKRVVSGLRSEARSAKRGPKITAEISVHCQCPEHVKIILDSDASQFITVDERKQLLRNACERSHNELREKLAADPEYKNDEPLLLDTLLRNEGTLACPRSTQCKGHEYSPYRDLLRGRFKPDPDEDIEIQYKGGTGLELSLQDSIGGRR